MNTYICMYLSIYIRMYAYALATPFGIHIINMYIGIHVCLYVCIYINMRAYVYVYICPASYTCHLQM